MNSIKPGGQVYLSLGLTPALQRTMVFDKFSVGEVNRAREVTLSAAGKGVNVGMALARLGLQSWITGFNGGDSGRILLEDARRRGAIPAFTRSSGRTRVCDTILEAAVGRVTELVEEAPPVDEPELERFQRKALMLERRCAALAISGTVPPALARHGVFVPFAREAERRRIPWIIDSHRDDLLSVLTHHPWVAKMNRHELGTTFGTECGSGRAILRLARRLTASGARAAMITDGPRASWLVDAEGHCWKLLPPVVARVVNPIGSGDCVTAATLAALARGGNLVQSACDGLACGSANAATLIPASFDLREMRRLRKMIVVEQVM